MVIPRSRSSKIHGVEKLVRHVTRGNGASAMQQPVRQCRLFAMVNVGNNAENF